MRSAKLAGTCDQVQSGAASETAFTFSQSDVSERNRERARERERCVDTQPGIGTREGVRGREKRCDLENS